MMKSNAPSSFRPWLGLFAHLLMAMAIYLVIGGGYLVWLAGSWDALLAGLMCFAVAMLLRFRRREALHLFAGLLGFTLIYSLFEVGLDGWQLLPRLDAWLALALVMLLPAFRRGLVKGAQRGALVLAVVVALSLVISVSTLWTHPDDINGSLQRGLADVLPQQQQPILATDPHDWPNYGGTAFAQHYSPVGQITPKNVKRLSVAWVYHTHDLPGPNDPEEITNEVTPLKIGNMLYLCTPHSVAIALDATTGEEKWRFDPHIPSNQANFKHWAHVTCRGVSYYDALTYQKADPAASVPLAVAQSDCPQRLFLPTADARLIALNAQTGQPCQSFGDHGTLYLLTDQLDGHNPAGGYYSTSPAAVARDIVIVGSHVTDNVSTREPSGVVRAFDVNDGHLVWNWDSGQPDQTKPLHPGEHYSHNSANVWSVITVDERLGLAYLPMGNQTPEQWGAGRSPGAEKYSSGVVALDLATGRVRWNYQMTHHDLWDRDISANPQLVDLQTKDGIKPALIESSKQGSIYVLDRRTGAPLFPIDEVKTPRDSLKGDWASARQPMSTINFTPAKLTEAAMWGATPFDQLYCRIRFRQMHYEGPYTPPSTQPTLIQPGNAGVFDWGGVALDPVRQVLVANPNSFAFVYQMIPAGQLLLAGHAASEGNGVQPNTGAPYAVKIEPFLTPWGVPCQAPPWGWVVAVDLLTGKTIWKHKNGTTRDSAPLGIPFPLGVFGQGGMLVTRGGVAFFAAALDNYMRAYDLRDGQTLFQARLPAGGQATPMSYQGADGRQYVVIMAGGHGSLKTKMGDTLIAFALPSR